MKLSEIKKRKNGEPLVVLTAYTYPIAKILDDYCDILLVGDSLGMTIYGHEDTLSVSMEMMINHAKAVKKGARKAFIVVDLPFASYESSKELALKNARRIIDETGCDAVKLETTREIIDTVKFLVQNGINVMGHIGLLPQHIKEYGGYKYQGKDQKGSEEILSIAKELEIAGAFAFVIEAVPASLAEKITASVSIPTIGIGASPNCDGQVLVIDDLLGLNQDFKPKFVKQYADLASQIKQAAGSYQKEVKFRQFPGSRNCI